MVEAAVMDEKQKERERGMIRDLLGERGGGLRKRREEEDKARNLIEEMQHNLDEAQKKSFKVERKLKAEWVSVKALQGACVLTSTKTKERQSCLVNLTKLSRDEFSERNWTNFRLKLRHQEGSASLTAESRGEKTCALSFSLRQKGWWYV